MDKVFNTVVISGNLAGLPSRQVIKNVDKVKTIPSMNAMEVRVGTTTTYLTPQPHENIQVLEQEGFIQEDNQQQENV